MKSPRRTLYEMMDPSEHSAYIAKMDIHYFFEFWSLEWVKYIQLTLEDFLIDTYACALERVQLRLAFVILQNRMHRY